MIFNKKKNKIISETLLGDVMTFYNPEFNFSKWTFYIYFLLVYIKKKEYQLF